jgi:hypothetical protein
MANIMSQTAQIKRIDLIQDALPLLKSKKVGDAENVSNANSVAESNQPRAMEVKVD